MNILDDYSASSSDSESQKSSQNYNPMSSSIISINPNPEVALVIPKFEIENSLNRVKIFI
jgi:hypothetical protein